MTGTNSDLTGGKTDDGVETGTTVPRGVKLAEIHPAVEAGVNNRDLGALMALYSEESRMVVLDGSVVTGLEAIREQWSAVLAMGATMTLRSRFAIEMGDLPS